MKSTICDRCGDHVENPPKDISYENWEPLDRKTPVALLMPVTDTQPMYRKWILRDLCGKCLDKLEKWFLLPTIKGAS